MNKLFYLLILVGLIYSNTSFSQVKFEKESRIKNTEVPLKAKLFIDSLSSKTKIKWYLEEGTASESIEAKFKQNNTKYSVEFDTKGNLEDIEIEEKWQNIDSSLTSTITNQLHTDCSKHKIIKVQKQFTGNTNDLYFFLFRNLKSKEIELKYEIIVKCRQSKSTDLFEYRFNDKGIVLDKSKIVFRNSTNLEY